MQCSYLYCSKTRLQILIGCILRVLTKCVPKIKKKYITRSHYGLNCQNLSRNYLVLFHKNRMTHYYCSFEVKIFLGLQLILRNLALHTFCFSVGLCSSKTQNFIMKTQRFVHPKQSMTEATFLTLGRSRSSHFKKLGIRPKT